MLVLDFEFDRGLRLRLAMAKDHLGDHSEQLFRCNRLPQELTAPSFIAATASGMLQCAVTITTNVSSPAPAFAKAFPSRPCLAF
jgi:hypothetical protein